MPLEFTITDGVGLMDAIAKSAGIGEPRGMMVMPESVGKGYIKTVDLGPLMKIMIHQYELAEDVITRRTSMKSGKDVLTFSFRNISRHHPNNILLPSVQVSSADMHFEMFTPSGTKIDVIIIHVHIDLLKDLLNGKEQNKFFNDFIFGNKPFLYEEIISPEIQDISKKIIQLNTPEELTDFFYKIKAEELIYLFFTEFLKRKHKGNYPLHMSDVKTIYSIRDKIISDLSLPPNLTELARFSSMSESKMSRMFRQIFGDSMYNYYQKLRMTKAASLIKEQQLSVSEAGYQLGFTNLSHFTKIFEKHIGLKPKKYSLDHAIPLRAIN